ncbi:sigma-70 family RNA polymerase sigma factor [Hamadaea sp. NPDC051192]|uniref:sigma-70 family RNA polymerase sigma factor n=1 Tax=Hamadaea sp. NPDC051192 TaxID=3154940 RepID=UPI003445C2FE
MTAVHRTVDAVWKLESARIIAGLTRLVHDVGLAEEFAQDALVAALEQWPSAGVPDNPGAWLTTIAKRRAIDHIRRSERLDRKHEELARDLDQQPDQQPDDVLRLMFISCHPVLPTAARVALTLRLIGGLTAAEIGRAFLTTEARITQRIAAAKQTLADERVPFELPAGPELAGRLSSVLEVVYLIFNEGYAASAGDGLIRADLCLEALRLGRQLAELAPDEPEVHGLVALMEIQASRSAARTGPNGEPVQLHEQNRGRWDQLLIRRGFTAMLRARDLGRPPGPYVLQAAIAVCHAQAPTAEDTDWRQIAALYEALARLLPTPIVQLNRAVAVGMSAGPQAGLDLVDALLTDPALQNYHLLPGVRGDLLARLDRPAEARREFERAAALTANSAEREFLRRRAESLPDDAPPSLTLGQATGEFLRREDLDAQTLRAYAQTLRRLCLAVGEGLPLAELTPDRVAQTFELAWAGAAARTWNRHRAAVRSFSAWADLPDLARTLDRRTEPPSPRRGLDLAELWAREVPLRERALWRLLAESSAGPRSVLALNVDDLDLDERRAWTGKTWITWRSQTASLLPGLIAGRERGPVFLADRRRGPGRPPAAADVCPHTGRTRLSYERAEYLFKQATGHTLRDLRES